MKAVKKDIFGKEIETAYIGSSGNRIIDNLQKQLTTMYLFLERKGLLKDDEFKDFADSIELAEQIEKINEPEEQMYPRVNAFTYVVHNEETTEYRDANPNTLIGSMGSRRRFMEDQLTGQSYDLEDTDDIRKLVEEINKRLKP